MVVIQIKNEVRPIINKVINNWLMILKSRGIDQIKNNAKSTQTSIAIKNIPKVIFCNFFIQVSAGRIALPTLGL